MAKEKKVFAFVDENLDDENSKNVEEFVANAKGQRKNFGNMKGRPEVAEHNKKKHSVMVYFTEAQKEELKRKAESNNLSLSKYISIKLFGID